MLTGNAYHDARNNNLPMFRSHGKLQMWACLGCRSRRQWGHGQPDDPNRTVLLTCECCSKYTNDGVKCPTSHEYVGCELQ